MNVPSADAEISEPPIDVSFVMPCLNEARWLGVCIGMAQDAAAELQTRFGLRSEIVIADNGSTDGSQQLAAQLGARVARVSERGYGAALSGGFRAARGRFLVMGDADGSYDFREAVGMVEALLHGADLCMGSRFKGGIKPGAMPWKNRYIGNPVLTGALNLLFRAGVSDAHCGLRALTRACFERLRLSGSGMEFASEMVIKAALRGEIITERPATLSPDLRDRPPHLRPWRDGWRHLRYLFMLSPWWSLGVPALVFAPVALAIMAVGGWNALFRPDVVSVFGDYWVVLAAALLSMSHMAAILGLGSHLYGIRQGYRRPRYWSYQLARLLSLESMLISGAIIIGLGMAVLVGVVIAWSARHFGPADSVFPAVAGTLLLTLGVQNTMGGFLLSVIGGNEARFFDAALPAREQAADTAADALAA